MHNLKVLLLISFYHKYILTLIVVWIWILWTLFSSSFSFLYDENLSSLQMFDGDKRHLNIGIALLLSHGSQVSIHIKITKADWKNFKFLWQILVILIEYDWDRAK